MGRINARERIDVLFHIAGCRNDTAGKTRLVIVYHARAPEQPGIQSPIFDMNGGRHYSIRICTRLRASRNL
jgi:hypothetical protein